MKYNKQITYLLLLIALLVQFSGMFLPFTGDAGKYAAISKNIFLHQNFLDLSLHESPYLQKPPFLMWLSACGYYLFGVVNNFTTRFFPVLFSLIMLYSIYRLGKLHYSAYTGKIAALFLGTSQIYFLYNADLHTDVVLVAAVTFSVWQLAEYIENKSRWNFVLAFIGIGVAMLTKGPIGIAVPVFALGSHLLMKRNFKEIFHPKWILGIAISFIMLLPYLNSLFQSFGWEGIKFYFWTNNAGRISGTYRDNHIDPFFYIYNLLTLIFPWSVFVIGGFIHFSKKLIQQKFSRISLQEYYSIGGSIFLMIILSLSSMKSPNYLYPTIPFFALIGAHYYQKMIQKEIKYPKYISVLNAIFITVTWALILILTLYIFPMKHIGRWVVLVALLAFCTLIYALKPGQRQKELLALLASILAFNFVVNTHLFPNFFNYQASLKAATIFNEKASSTDIFYTYRYAQYEMFFYAKNTGYRVLDEGHLNEPGLIKPEVAFESKGAWFLVNKNSYNELKKSKLEFEETYEFDHFYLTDINWKFLNPKTRESSLMKMYLIKTKAEY